MTHPDLNRLMEATRARLADLNKQLRIRRETHRRMHEAAEGLIDVMGELDELRQELSQGERSWLFGLEQLCDAALESLMHELRPHQDLPPTAPASRKDL